MSLPRAALEKLKEFQAQQEMNAEAEAKEPAPQQEEPAIEQEQPQEEVMEEAAPQEEAVEQEEPAAVEETMDSEEAPLDDKKAKEAFYKLRKEKKESEERIRELEDQLKGGDDKVSTMERELAEVKAIIANAQQQVQQPQQAPVDANVPDFDTDPEEWSKYTAEKQSQELSALRQQVEAQAQIQQFAVLEGALSQGDPEYKAKKDYIIQKEVQKAILNNPTINEAQYRAAVEQNYSLEAAKMLQSGANVLDSVNKYAELYGYVPPAAQKKAVPEPAKKPEISLAKVRQNQETSTGILGGAAPSGDSGMSLAMKIFKAGGSAKDIHFAKKQSK